MYALARPYSRICECGIETHTGHSAHVRVDSIAGAEARADAVSRHTHGAAGAEARADAVSRHTHGAAGAEARADAVSRHTLGMLPMYALARPYSRICSRAFARVGLLDQHALTRINSYLYQHALTCINSYLYQHARNLYTLAAPGGSSTWLRAAPAEWTGATTTTCRRRRVRCALCCLKCA